MSIPIDSQNFESYVPVYDVAPSNLEELRAFIVEQLKRHANAINVRVIGFLLDQELLTGKSFIPGINDLADGGTSQQYRSVLRKVIDFGVLPNNTSKSVPHGINVDGNFTLIQMWASATNPTGTFPGGLQSIPIPYASPTAPVQMYMDSVNVNILTTSNMSTFTRCFVFIEYIQEV